MEFTELEELTTTSMTCAAKAQRKEMKWNHEPRTEADSNRFIKKETEFHGTDIKRFGFKLHHVLHWRRRKAELGLPVTYKGKIYNPPKLKINKQTLAAIHLSMD